MFISLTVNELSTLFRHKYTTFFRRSQITLFSRETDDFITENYQGSCALFLLSAFPATSCHDR